MTEVALEFGSPASPPVSTFTTPGLGGGLFIYFFRLLVYLVIYFSLYYIYFNLARKYREW